MFCGKCGKENKEAAKYCGCCGARLETKTKTKETKMLLDLVEKKKWHVILIVSLICISFCVFCGIYFNRPQKKIVGEWYEISDGERDESAFIFYEDGTFTGEGEQGTYRFMNGKLVMRYGWVASKFEFTYSYKFRGKCLILTNKDGDIYEFVKD